MRLAILTMVGILFFENLSAQETCYDAECHTKFNKFEYLHEAAEDDCLNCHEALGDPEEELQKTGKHRFGLMETGSALCYDCHDSKDEGKVVHKPVALGDCGDCHDPHGSNHEYMLPTASEQGLCIQCHDDLDFAAKKYLHGPMASGDCVLCHSPHSSDNKSLLVSSEKKLCLECHEEKDFSGEAKHMHAPLEDGCLDCHDAHASQNPFQLLSAAEELCMECHEEVFAYAESATYKHAIVGKKKKCLNCHDAHGSLFENNLLDNPLDLCLNCHNQAIIGSDGKDYNIYKIVKENPFKHGPIKEGNCTGCHHPHGSENYKILKGEFPKRFYTAFGPQKYGLCFDCHEIELVEAPKTLTMTDFRDGDNNLHYLHVNREKKGRTCRACHEIHASELPKHIRVETPFGKWDIPIKFKMLPDGGSCDPGCHKPKTYSRKSPPKGTGK